MPTIDPIILATISNISKLRPAKKNFWPNSVQKLKITEPINPLNIKVLQACFLLSQEYKTSRIKYMAK